MWVRFIFILPDYITFFTKDTERHAPVDLNNVHPILRDKTKTTHFERQYVYHTAWAVRCVQKIHPTKHIDFGSILYFPITLSAFIPTEFYDYRPAQLELPGLVSKFGNLVGIDLADNSQESVSCLHTIEHIGLGRYGDPIDPEGDRKAIRELSRIVAPLGSLLIVVPMGIHQRTEFNAHRIYEYETFVSYFPGFELVDFSYIPQDEKRGGLLMNTDPSIIGTDTLGCGCFWFKKMQ